MNVLLIQPEGVDLYATLLNSETSRDALRFYQPDRLEYGILVRTASLGSALALVSELRWYIQRYVEEVLFEPERGIFCSSSLGRQIYERDVKPTSPWRYRCLYRISSHLVETIWMDAGTTPPAYADRFEPGDTVLEVWCTEEEYRTG
ncbi:MAG TPA: DUF5804 family protein [Candidatus Methanoculleus thermohydrogenotrophicum]|jgi:hypothetical protein|nr:DUF5804 family protein [Candidatus Methanoculleus thermohydrogenotrophicum]NLM81813.1 hypothetical protein [Candidatus Methanoculleus thermohydrogenotrophicum]HOB17563.1 DUF5804 family protein [Candidatus Methanoculleus thermohydrogenotrophicum]HPZ37719.1 DUF5804 family protein [Candidatus Methanoculleus thermohydrogenotrophicum]HQC90822.1 DUF5804 family protein [Candidatus Methanoculleus thermohydrogenotrophicum]